MKTLINTCKMLDIHCFSLSQQKNLIGTEFYFSLTLNSVVSYRGKRNVPFKRVCTFLKSEFSESKEYKRSLFTIESK
jgi:hypothetical protein